MQYFIFQLKDSYKNFVTLFDGVCDETKDLATLYSSTADDVKLKVLSSGRYMFTKFSVYVDEYDFDFNHDSPTGFLANIHNGKEILN